MADRTETRFDRGRAPIHAIRRTPEIVLDGEWQFALTRSADQSPDLWSTATVPSVWNFTQPSDGPHYTNVRMPFDEVPPTVPTDNPTGTYRRTFDFDGASERRVFLHVGAAEGQLEVAVNGRVIGASTDSHLEAEFDITSAVVSGTNTLELRVSKWSAETYLEDQDQWWFGGLTRSVFIYTLPEVHLADVVTVADFDPETQRGRLSVRASTHGLDHLLANDWSIDVAFAEHVTSVPVAARVAPPQLPDSSPNREQRPQPMLPPDFMDMISINAAQAPVPTEFRALPGIVGAHHGPMSPAGVVDVVLDELEVAAWTAETPHLETLTVRLKDGSGTVRDTAQVRVGFRRIEIAGRDLLVNGERILIQGVNRHDFNPQTGRALTRDDMLADLTVLKRHNVNAIRCAHYPNDPVFLDLCDEIGFYIVDEADVEAHAFASILPDDPRYLAPILERVSRMVVRDRNHPSVIIWSLGNESGYGATHDAAAAWLRKFDPTRPIQYEGAIATDWYGGHAASDIVAPMYPSFASLTAASEDPRSDRPIIFCEYAYSQGNSTGGLAHYWSLFESLPGLQGGFIWEFKDHALDPDGDGRFRYGGDFGDTPHDGSTVLNGIVFADLSPKPALLEARGLFSPVRITSSVQDALAGRIVLRNRQTFADLSGLRLAVHVETSRGAGPAHSLGETQAPPGQEVAVTLGDEIMEELAHDDALAISITVYTAHDAIWAPADTVLSVEQLKLPRKPVVLPEAIGPAEVSSSGQIEHPMLRAAPRLHLWRALTDNDGSFALDNRFVRSGFFHLEEANTVIEATDSATLVHIDYRTAYGDTVEHHRAISRTATGWLFVEDVRLPEGTTDGLRVGIQLELQPGFHTAEWVGLGPWENYTDRQQSALLGRWTSAIDDLSVPYVVPQANGSRTGVTELVLDSDESTMTTLHASPLHFDAGRHSDAELEGATHWWKLPVKDGTVVHLDAAHRGVGTGLLGPDTRPDHRLTSTKYQWSWHLSFIEKEETS